MTYLVAISTIDLIEYLFILLRECHKVLLTFSYNNLEYLNPHARHVSYTFKAMLSRHHCLSHIRNCSHQSWPASIWLPSCDYPTAGTQKKVLTVYIC